jgi:hypothetical protein
MDIVRHDMKLLSKSLFSFLLLTLSIAAVIWMKFSRKEEDSGPIEVKPYRISFIRATLLVTGARHEAQLQVSLSSC